MKAGIIGSGIVGKTLATGLVRHGHDVTLGTRNTAQMDEWAKDNPRVRIGSPADAAKFGEVVILAVKGSAAEDAVRTAGVVSLAGKTVIDTNNPIADNPPANGVLSFFTSPNESLMERLQKAFPDVRFVKAFSCVGAARMVDPSFAGGKPTMFICGNDDKAKAAVTGLLDELNWETEDMGAVEAARAIEPLCILWCIPGFLHNHWTHAFKLLK